MAGDPHPHHSHRALAGAVRAVSGVTLLSRLGGLVRDVLVVLVFGDTAVGSAFWAGFAIPNMFRRLFGEGALSAAFIPEYAGTDKADPAAAQRFASLTVAALAAVTSILTAVIELGLLAALWLLPADADRELSIRLIMVMFPFMPFICVTAILGGMLQVHGRFGPAASGPLVLNGFMIAVSLWHLLTGSVGENATAYTLGVATTLSGLTQAVWFVILLRPHVRWTRAWDEARPRAKRMLARMIPVLIGTGSMQLGSLMDTLVAMWPTWVGATLLGFVYPLDEGSNSILAAAQRLYQFPLGVFGIAVATAVFPTLSRQADDAGQFGETLRRGLRLSLFIGLPASVGLLLVRHDVMPVLFHFGNRGFSADGLLRAAAVLAGYAPAIWAYSLNQLFTRAFYAKGDMATPMRVGIATVVLNALLTWALIWPLREAGMGWSTSFAATAQCLTLAWLAHRRLGITLLDRPALEGIARLVLLAALMGAAVWAVQTILPAAASWRQHALRLASACASGALVYPVLSLLLRAPELRWILHRAPAR